MPYKKLKSKLDRIATHIGPNKSGSATSDIPKRYRKLAGETGGRIVEQAAGTYCLIRTHYGRDYAHGTFDFGSVSPKKLPLSAFTALDEQGQLDVRSMLFIDTETTGLGGAGAVPFLVGCGSVTPRGFEIRQYLLPDYADEAAMLEDVLTEFSSEGDLVSYNGAAFDLPLIRDRMIINRVAGDVDYRHHLDLLHSTRRLFKRRLQDCTLTNIEANLLDFRRTDDVPGYLIPSIYFEWLSEDNLDLMAQVLEHNRLDIVSLYCLVYQIADVHDSRGEVLDEVDDLHSLSRVYGRRRKIDLVSEIFDKMENVYADDLSDDILLYHSMNFKRSGNLDRAVEMWRQLSRSSSREAYWANIELAKYYEHKEQNPGRALKHAQKADKICPYSKAHQKQLARRLVRLESKLKP